jgi:XTP/dITP diphosphohydrolase
MKLIFASSNKHKLHEIRSLAPPGIQIVSMQEMGYTDELSETQNTIEGNSLQKAQFLAEKYGINCFAEDTGLEIEALNGEPGVYSARYAGPGATYEDNVNKVLKNMQHVVNRRARFKTVITYYQGSTHVQFEGISRLKNQKSGSKKEGMYLQFEGITEGVIIEERRGISGFGYDPIFIPDGSDKTYAEMTLEEKNGFSHRKKSFEPFANHLRQIAV